MAKPRMDLSAFVGKLLEEQDGDVLREGIRVLSQALMETEVAGLIGAERHERSGDRSAYRNGTRTRTWDTRVGTIELAIPKVRPGTYFPSLLQPRRRAEHALLAVVQEAYLRNLNEFYGDGNFLGLTPPFRKFSAFHFFIEFIIDDMMSDEVNEVKLDIRQDSLGRFKNVPSAWVFDTHPAILPVNTAFARYGIEHESFEEWLTEQGKTFIDATDDDVQEYYSLLREDGTWEIILERATHEVFFVLFQNRDILLLFNDMIADQVKDYGDEVLSSEQAELFAKAGVLKRVSIPEWVRRAVFFRDRGLCVLCHRDLTGIVNIWSDDNYDHIVPLAGGGLNDVSNIQLLCRECNSKKRAGQPSTSNRYEAWYPGD